MQVEAIQQRQNQKVNVMETIIESVKLVEDGHRTKFIRVFFVNSDYFLDIPEHQFAAWTEEDFILHFENIAA